MNDQNDRPKFRDDDDDDERPKKRKNDSDTESDNDASVIYDSDSDVEDDDDDDEYIKNDEGDDDDDDTKNANSKNKQNSSAYSNDEIYDDDDDEMDDDEPDENYLQKMEHDAKHDIMTEYHPELITHTVEEVEAACTIIRDERGSIIDPMHLTIPFVTRYEKARVIGERAKQLNSGAKPFIEIEPSMIDGYLIALREFEEKKIPFIIKRPLPNGGCEYWKVSDLVILV